MYKFMRVVVLFDLPTGTKAERRAATQFRKSLLDDGFDMLQYSVYSRLCPNRDGAEKHMLRVKRSAPDSGSVRVLYLTEHQFTNMHIIVGEKTTQEELLPTKQLAFF
ncbi:MAG TPA: CRISPR-associated endonuclease Cas2 [Candidatus Saccharibacteria bacterium]|nr:CRISPR-associated endonuclease Cas2 [Candidatus Saccharibacteria bacterium]HMR38042.1 CRISPR-associated endonuclease Cas2 [Candidatus Saccharibacteria bacterium]